MIGLSINLPSLSLPTTSEELHDDLILVQRISYCVGATGILTLMMYLLNNQAVPMGKHLKNDGGVKVNARWSWILQEMPSFFVGLAVFIQVGANNINIGSEIVVCLFLLHYFNRSFIYPFQMSSKSTPVPLTASISAFVFTSGNAFAITRYALIHDPIDNNFMKSTQFVIGISLWLFGFVANMHSDRILLTLRKPGESGYKIPRGGLFEYVSGANFFAEIVEWWGLAIATGFHLPLLCFAFQTTFTIGTRACASHRWYLMKFEDYPKSRRAIIPFIL